MLLYFRRSHFKRIYDLKGKSRLTRDSNRLLKNLTQRLTTIKIRAEDNSIWRRFSRNVSISVFGSGLSLAIKLLQTALLTRMLRIEDYGRVVIVLNLFVFLEAFFGFE